LFFAAFSGILFPSIKGSKGARLCLGAAAPYGVVITAECPAPYAIAETFTAAGSVCGRSLFFCSGLPVFP
jgi:hypothetical protein